jgi:iron(III) transport system substrate-binding protein
MRSARVVPRLTLLALGALLAAALAVWPGAPPTAAQGGTLTVYSGRAESLIGPLLASYREASGMDVRVRYGDTAELAATIVEEGSNSPADVFFAQDAGALGALDTRGLLRRLPEDLIQKVPPQFRSPVGDWVGVSGRARVIVYNPTLVNEADLPDTVLGLTDPRWRGKIGWAPTNGSFQAFVTAMRATEGDAATRAWLQGMRANNARNYNANPAIVQAVANGEIEVGLVNHYYLYNLQRDRGAMNARNYYPRAGGPGAMINVAGVGILNSSRNVPAAERFVGFLLSPVAQQYFSERTFEYPLAEGVAPSAELPSLASIPHPNIDLNSLRDLEGTLRMLQDLGIL